MQKINRLVLAVSAALMVGTVSAADIAPADSVKNAVTSAVNKIEEAVKTGNVKPLAPQSAAKTDTKNDAVKPIAAGEKAYPEIPARYLRPDATKAEQAKAVDGLKKAAAAPAPAAKSEPASGGHEYNKVAINTNAVIAMKPGDNVFIPISREHPNRLLTPFLNPQIISTTLSGGRKAGECGEVCVRNGVIYITTDSPSAVTAFITEKGHEDVAFSVTMVPQAIPPREVRFTLPASVVEELRRNKAGSVGMKRAQAWEMSQPYVETLKTAMRSVALGRVPDGYSLRKVKRGDKVPTCKHPGLKIDFREGQVLEGYNLDIFVGVITNTANKPIEFRNQNCGSWVNAAVTSWPLTVLHPDQQTEIYIAVKHADEIPEDMTRKPLIDREYN